MATEISITGAPSCAPTTRRSMLAGVGIAAAAASLPLKPTLTSSSRWASALAHCENALAVSDDATAKLSQARRLYAETKPKPLGGAQFHRGDTVDSYHARVRTELAAFVSADAQCHRACNIDALDKQAGHAIDAADDAFEAMFSIPAPDFVAVIRKIELADRFDRQIDDLDPVIADIRRLSERRI